MLLQVITGNKSVSSFHPIAVHPDNVLAACWVDPRKVFAKPDWDEHVTYVILKEEIAVDLDEDRNATFSKQILVTGHFQEISIGLGLDTTGQIAEELALKES